MNIFLDLIKVCLAFKIKKWVLVLLLALKNSLILIIKVNNKIIFNFKVCFINKSKY